MKNSKLLFSILAVLLICGFQSLRAQSATSITDLTVYDKGDGTGWVQVVVTGPDAETVEPGDITLNGARIDGGRFTTIVKVSALKPGTAVMVAAVPMRVMPAGASTNIHFSVKVPYKHGKIVRQHLEEVGMTKSEFAR
jgi:hypothetical protein